MSRVTALRSSGYLVLSIQVSSNVTSRYRPSPELPQRGWPDPSRKPT